MCLCSLPCSLRLAAFTAALALDALSSSVATNSDTATATLDPAQDSPSSETTTLTCSLSTPANEPPEHSLAPAPSPESNSSLSAVPPPITSASAVEAKVAPPLVVPRRSSGSAEEQDKKVAPAPPPAAAPAPPQKSETPIPPKRRHSPKLAALNARNSPPVSPLATSSACSSPSFETKKPAPRPPVGKPPVQPSAEPPSQNPRSNSDPPAVAQSSSRHHTAPSVQEAVDPAALLTNVPSPLPITSIPAPSNHLPTSLAGAYDMLAPDTGDRGGDFDLELTNGTETPSAIPEDLISLESPPPAPSLANGDGADLPPQAPETLAKTAPPVNDEYGSL